MESSFNPYHQWLGIPPTEQPPNLYRLLGIPLFETDAAVIDNGAMRQMAHIKAQATGPRVADSQRLLNELSHARVILLTADRRTAYDELLRKDLAQPTPKERTGTINAAGNLVPSPSLHAASSGWLVDEELRLAAEDTPDRFDRVNESEPYNLRWPNRAAYVGRPTDAKTAAEPPEGARRSAGKRQSVPVTMPPTRTESPEDEARRHEAHRLAMSRHRLVQGFICVIGVVTTLFVIAILAWTLLERITSQ